MQSVSQLFDNIDKPKLSMAIVKNHANYFLVKVKTIVGLESDLIQPCNHTH